MLVLRLYSLGKQGIKFITGTFTFLFLLNKVFYLKEILQQDIVCELCGSTSISVQDTLFFFLPNSQQWRNTLPV